MTDEWLAGEVTRVLGWDLSSALRRGNERTEERGKGGGKKEKEGKGESEEMNVEGFVDLMGRLLALEQVGCETRSRRLRFNAKHIDGPHIMSIESSSGVAGTLAGFRRRSCVLEGDQGWEGRQEDRVRPLTKTIL